MIDKKEEKKKLTQQAVLTLGMLGFLSGQFAGPVAYALAETSPPSHVETRQQAKALTVTPRDLLVGSQPINAIFPDANLAAAVANRLQKDPTTFVTQADLNTVTTLQPAAGAPIQNINSLEGIQFLTRMTTFGITSGRLGDASSLAPLEGLAGASLTTLNLGSAQITDISALANLTQLRNLSLVTNRISNIDAIGNLKELRSLNLTSNRITDLSPLQNLPSNILTDLTLSENLGIGASTTVDTLSHFTELARLTLANTGIVTLAPLAGMNNLIYLSLGRNQIDDVGLQAGNLSAKTKLETLYLRNNMITEEGLSELSALSKLTSLYLSSNRIADPQIGNTPYALSALSSLGALRTLEINDNMLRSLAPLQVLGSLTTLSATGQTWRKADTVRGQAPNEPVGIYNKANTPPNNLEQLNIVQGTGSIEFVTPPVRVFWETLGDNSLEWNMSSGIGTGIFSGTSVHPTLAETGEANPELGQINLLFPDPGLAQAVADELGVAVSHVLMQEEADSIENLVASGRNISNLNGLNLLRHLITLDLSNNNLNTGSLSFFANVQTGGLQDLTTILLNQNHINDLRPIYHFRGGTIGGLTLSALNQTISLSPVAHQEASSFSIYNVQEIHNRTSIALDNVPEGSHIADQLLWDYIGENQVASWAARDIDNISSGQFSGQVVQTVTPNAFDIPINQIFSDSKVQEAIAQALTEGRDRPSPVPPVAVTDYTSAAELALLGLETAGNKYPNNLTLEGISSLDGPDVLGGGAHYVGIAALPNLQELSITNSSVTNFVTLTHLPNMRALTINTTSGIAAAMEIFTQPNLRSVNHLTLKQNGIADVSDLSGLSGLHSLTLNNNQIADLGALNPLLEVAPELEQIEAQNQVLSRPAVLVFTDSPTDVFNIDQRAVDASKWHWNQGKGNLHTQPSPSQTFVNYSQVLEENSLGWEVRQTFTSNPSVAVDFSGHITQSSLAQAPSASAPTRPTIDRITGNFSEGYVVTGTGQPGETILLRDAEGDIIGKAVVDDNGTWTITIPKGRVRPGEKVSALAQNAEGKNSDAVYAVIPEDLASVEEENETLLPALGDGAFPLLLLGTLSIFAVALLWLKRLKNEKI